MICCPQNNLLENRITSIQNQKTDLFPVECGVTVSLNKISGGKSAEVGQFPWMALLGYKSK